ncbi:MAG: hypothetical protein IJU62_00005 [Muribaculaceae bacterium]|nr:hypothetical protein [Muribaculaceae bacterium]
MERATHALDWLDEPSPVPVRMERIGRHRALAADFAGVPFEIYIVADNLYQGFLATRQEALQNMQQSTAFVCVSDIANGYTELNNTPRTRRVKTIFMAMRHKIDDMAARNTCMDIMRELFRQYMSLLILEKTKLEQQCIYLDPRISFNEIDRYFFSGCACAFFQVAVDVYTDLRYNAAEWE